MAKPKMLSKREKDLFDALQDVVTVKDAALKIGLSPKTGYNMMARLRQKYTIACHFVNWYRGQMRRSKHLKTILTNKAVKRAEAEAKRLQKLEAEETEEPEQEWIEA